MDRAIQESLQGSYNEFADEPYEETPIEERVRQGNRYVLYMKMVFYFDAVARPIALRPTRATLTYAALLVQGLFFVPQVRLGIARFRPTGELQSREGTSHVYLRLLNDLLTAQRTCCGHWRSFIQTWTSPSSQSSWPM